ncbi:hypothetical protein DXG03_005506 [Asterophora parasitica]|uniref:Uncharacterized protein n=1 Tax=Asterophora parasitica TaxID=117018 RepID=A0A9P7G8W9_9AGAR|nr:hypothetical protein DXG03_005506 [Asterophora parasitica]
MSFFSKLKAKASRKSGSREKGQQAQSTTDAPPTQTFPSQATQSAEPQEQQFTTQPHPAKTNDPADLQRQQPGGGLATSDPMAAHHARDPYVPSQEIQSNLEQPLGRDELRARAAELNAPGPHEQK